MGLATNGSTDPHFLFENLTLVELLPRVVEVSDDLILVLRKPGRSRHESTRSEEYVGKISREFVTTEQCK